MENDYNNRFASGKLLKTVVSRVSKYKTFKAKDWLKTEETQGSVNDSFRPDKPGRKCANEKSIIQGKEKTRQLWLYPQHLWRTITFLEPQKDKNDSKHSETLRKETHLLISQVLKAPSLACAFGLPTKTTSSVLSTTEIFFFLIGCLNFLGIALALAESLNKASTAR